MICPGQRQVLLTYCLNVHPGADLPQLEQALFHKAPAVFKHFSGITGQKGPFGLGPWLSAQNAQALCLPGAAEKLAARLADRGFFVFTINGFIYGPFHGERVKEKVYSPDWTRPARLEYTLDLARILVRLLPTGGFGTISTLPVAYGPAYDTGMEQALENLARTIAELHRIFQETGKTIMLCLEPEPDCLLEDAQTTVDFWENQLRARGTGMLARLMDQTLETAGEVLNQHLGVCLDLVHAGVVFDDPVQMVETFQKHQVPIGKVQVGAALAASNPGAPATALEAFDESTYLHQTRVLAGQNLERHPDLGEALAAHGQASGQDARWRVHFHVPLSWEGNDGLTGTSDLASREFFRAAIQAGVKHFEVETYTLGVMPHKTGADEIILARDMAWVLHKMNRKTEE